MSVAVAAGHAGKTAAADNWGPEQVLLILI